eukprot:CAMPEP_0115063960 /NCGR_PEP_ID=MMETSP0227-20121206/9404_1 /TAXON_ID=89957 /ORGANISM="Polarella glacialis, Strain CCMP 1383" /LENGTH=393 /DNA_ID=CAMNT_0002449533 /DNA_START=59 /DNA_END=1240 /DNA_ORIENTATION=-
MQAAAAICRRGSLGVRAVRLKPCLQSAPPAATTLSSWPSYSAPFCTSATPSSSSSSSAVSPVSSLAPTSSTSPASASSTEVGGSGVGGALAHADPSCPPAVARAGDIIYGAPLETDFEGGGARHASAVGALNIPSHVRDSFRTPMNMDEAPRSTVPHVFDSVMTQAKQLVASTGLAPSHWASAADAAAPYYGGEIPLAPYKKGQTAAYHYPSVLVPRNLANRFPLDLYVDPVFATSDPAQRIRMKGFTLFPRLQGKTTLVLCFSGQPLSGLWTGLRHWLDSVGEDFTKLPNTQVFKLHAEEGWFNRRTHALTKFHLRRQVDESELWTTFVYRGKWKWEYVYNLHLYNKDLPVVLLLDPLGYVRWHAVGLPTHEATDLFRTLAARLAREKKNYA